MSNATEIPRIVELFKRDIDAAAVVLIERRGSGVDRWPATPPDVLRDVLEQLPCLRFEWAGWQRDLLAAEEHNATCLCGDLHQLHGVVIDGRWMLVMVTRNLILPNGSFEPTKAAAYATWIHGIRLRLEEGGTRGRRSGSSGGSGGGTGSAELGIPLSWHRKSHE